MSSGRPVDAQRLCMGTRPASTRDSVRWLLHSFNKGLGERLHIRRVGKERTVTDSELAMRWDVGKNQGAPDGSGFDHHVRVSFYQARRQERIRALQPPRQ